MAEVMREVAAWPRARQNKLAAYLLHLRMGSDAGWRKEMARRVDDKDPNNWVSLDKVKVVDLQKSGS
jgi:hypothetical protein